MLRDRENSRAAVLTDGRFLSHANTSSSMYTIISEGAFGSLCLPRCYRTFRHAIFSASEFTRTG